MSAAEIAILASAAALSIAGVGLALLATAIARRLANLVSLLGGVVILLVAVFHLAPEAIHAGVIAVGFLLGGAAVGVGLEFMLQLRKGAAGSASLRFGAWLGLVVLGVHSTLDGAVYAAFFWRGDSAELVASLGLILHEAPEGVAAMALSLQAGLRPWPAMLAAVLASSLTTPIGWGLAHLIGQSGDTTMQALYAASAGLMLYVGWHLIAGGWKGMQQSRVA